jgi:sulfide dehydrogenase [flavocytochrome c] flavoprotein subunit
MKPSRRDFLKLAGAAGISLFSPLVRAAEILPAGSAQRVVIVGGGMAGAVAAKTLRMTAPEIEVVLVERNRSYCALPGANWALGGHRRIGENRLNYDRLESAYGVKMIYGAALELDVSAKRVVLAAGTVPYDYAIVAPGIGFRTSGIEGYGVEAAETFPHAWTSGEEIVALKKRLDEMSAGGLVVVSLPAPPYRCPQAAYERVSQIACHLKQAKARAKIIVLDASPGISTMAGLFKSGWNRDYKDMIEYRGGQAIARVEAARNRIVTESESLRADVANLIPPQGAGALAITSGLTGDDKRWCPVDHANYESTVAPGVYVVGDACLAEGLQKSGSAANAQGKACAMAIAATVRRQKINPHVYANAVYSLLNANEGASSIVMVRGEGRRPTVIEKGGGDSSAWTSLEAVYAKAWLGSVLTEMCS